MEMFYIAVVAVILVVVIFKIGEDSHGAVTKKVNSDKASYRLDSMFGGSRGRQVQP